MQGFITDCVDMTIRKWKREEQLAEKDYYPKYKSAILALVCISCVHIAGTNHCL